MTRPVNLDLSIETQLISAVLHYTGKVKITLIV